MKREIIIIPAITKPDLPFNHVVRADRFLFLTSQLSVDLKTGIIQSGNIVEQTQRSLDNIKFLLANCGATMDDIVKVVIYMRNLKDFDKVNEIYSQYFTKGNEPARVTIQAISPIENIDIEIEIVAFK
jgi:2-iminobutanoate/2-iminopropanoate deaminase